METQNNLDSAFAITQEEIRARFFIDMFDKEPDCEWLEWYHGYTSKFGHIDIDDFIILMSKYIPESLVSDIGENYLEMKLHELIFNTRINYSLEDIAW